MAGGDEKSIKNTDLPPWMLFGKQMRKELKCLKKGDTVLISDYTEPCLFKALNASVAPGVRKCLWIWNPVCPSAYERTLFRYRQIESAGLTSVLSTRVMQNDSTRNSIHSSSV